MTSLNEPDPFFDSRPPAMPTDAGRQIYSTFFRVLKYLISFILSIDLKFDSPDTPQTEVTKEPAQDSYRFYQINYYRPWFDVDTKDVLARMFKAIVPIGQNFIDYVSPTPDL
jgi:hypothetical protein